MGSPEQQLVSVIVPVYNESDNLDAFYKLVTDTLEGLPYGIELVFVDDGSSDGSVAILRKLASRDERVRPVELVRNFGKEIALTAGLEACRGDAAVLMDADFQHPVVLLPDFIDKWAKGAEVVIGMREDYRNAPRWRRFGSWMFYKLLNAISETKIDPRASDYRLLDRSVIDAFCRFTERQRITRGLIDWLGYRRECVYFTAKQRSGGTSAYDTAKLVKLALTSVVSLSLFPLKVAGYLGSFITVLSGLTAIFIIVEKYVLNDPLNLYFSGPALLVTLNVFLVGLVLICMGLIAFYIAAIHGEVVNRPLYLVRSPGRRMVRDGADKRPL